VSFLLKPGLKNHPHGRVRTAVPAGFEEVLPAAGFFEEDVEYWLVVWNIFVSPQYVE